MRLKNILLVVQDMERSKQFYRELFGLEVVLDFGENVVLTEGLALQEKKLWERFIGEKVGSATRDAELYFEENDLDGFLRKLGDSNYPIRYVNPVTEYHWGQRVVRIYDPDGHIIEVGEAMEFVARRFLACGMTVLEVARKTQLPDSMVEELRRAMGETSEAEI